MTYNRKQGKRASGLRANGQREMILALLTQRYEGKLRMCNCGANTVTQPPINEPQEGDILVEALYAPAKQQGPVSGRLYPRTGNGRKLYVDPRDVAARPNWWRVPLEVQAEVISPAVEEVTNLANAALSQTIDDTPIDSTTDEDEAVNVNSQGFTWDDYSDEDKEILSRTEKPKGKPKK